MVRYLLQFVSFGWKTDACEFSRLPQIVRWSEKKIHQLIVESVSCPRFSTTQTRPALVYTEIPHHVTEMQIYGIISMNDLPLNERLASESRGD